MTQGIDDFETTMRFHKVTDIIVPIHRLGKKKYSPKSKALPSQQAMVEMRARILAMVDSRTYVNSTVLCHLGRSHIYESSLLVLCDPFFES